MQVAGERTFRPARACSSLLAALIIFIFLRLKVVLQAKPCKGWWMAVGGLFQTPARTSDTKNYMYPPAGGAIT